MFAPRQTMGVGLRLSALASEALAAPRELDRFKDFLAREGLYVFTINGFPYGPFHGTRVKEDVYQPDWRFPERLAYSNRLADLLAALLPDDPELQGSVSTVPATFRPIGEEPGAIQAIADNLLRHAAHLVRLEQQIGPDHHAGARARAHVLPRDHRRGGKVLRGSISSRQRPSTASAT